MTRVLNFFDGQTSASTPTPLNGRLVTGTSAAPVGITAGGGVSMTAVAQDEVIYVEGSGGAVDITVNPQIAAGAFDGQCLWLIGTSDTNTLLFEDGNGIEMDGTILLSANTVLALIWNNSSSLWLRKFTDDPT